MTLNEFRSLASDHGWWEACYKTDAPTEWLKTQAKLLTTAQQHYMRSGYLNQYNSNTISALKRRGMLEKDGSFTLTGKFVCEYLQTPGRLA